MGSGRGSRAVRHSPTNFLANLPCKPYNLHMTIKLTAQQEALVERAMARGMAASPEDVVTAALRSVVDDVEPAIEARLGMSREQLDHELRKGLEGSSHRWEGADAFHQKMRAKHQAVLGERPSK